MTRCLDSRFLVHFTRSLCWTSCTTFRWVIHSTRSIWYVARRVSNCVICSSCDASSRSLEVTVAVSIRKSFSVSSCWTTAVSQLIDNSDTCAANLAFWSLTMAISACRSPISSFAATNSWASLCAWWSWVSRVEFACSNLLYCLWDVACKSLYCAWDSKNLVSAKSASSDARFKVACKSRHCFWDSKSLVSAKSASSDVRFKFLVRRWMAFSRVEFASCSSLYCSWDSKRLFSAETASALRIWIFKSLDSAKSASTDARFKLACKSRHCFWDSKSLVSAKSASSVVRFKFLVRRWMLFSRVEFASCSSLYCSWDSKRLFSAETASALRIWISSE